jgi:cytochrome c oxidase subunit II
MRSTLISIVLAILLFGAAPLGAAEAWLPIAGSVGVFRTDARVFNPSFTADIEVVATFLPDGNVSNLGRSGVTITVPKRSMRVFDDVVEALFNASGLGAIRFVSNDDFSVTSRVYAQTEGGTLGQFLIGHEPTKMGVSRGVLLHLKSNSAFRTNIGLTNLGTGTATVRVQLYDRDNQPAGQPNSIVLQPLGVVGPSNIIGGFFGNPGAADLTDAWAYVSTADENQRVLAYGSVIDNATTDPLYIPVIVDTAVQPPPPQVTRTFEIDARQFQFDIRPGGALQAQVGDRVILRLRSLDVTHGFSLPPFVPDMALGANVVEVSFDATHAGSFFYFCTFPTCGAGHNEMTGTMTITPKD